MHQQAATITRIKIATAIAVLFHLIGLAGILFYDRSFFIKTTPLNMLLMFALLCYTQEKLNRAFLFFILLCFIVGLGVEIIGTRTGYLFGTYAYGNVLGPKIMEVPLIIAVNWFIVIYCCGTALHLFLESMLNRNPAIADKPKAILKTLAIAVDGAMLAVLFDWLMEPVAIKLGYWNWGGNGNIPFYNYACWFGISAVLLLAFSRLRFPRRNKFAVHLLLIQAMFFLILRTFL
jgi:putative membrane protein